MIELTQLDGSPILINCNLIETVINIPETKVSLTTGKYHLVLECREEIMKKIVAYHRSIFSNIITVQEASQN